MIETDNDNSAGASGLQVALFVTCLADLFRPSVAFASLALLRRAGCRVSVPRAQTCCGQPAYNAGDYSATKPLIKRVIQMLEPADYVVVPSGSCAGMICQHYPRLLSGQWRERALELSAKTFELTTFLRDIAGLSDSARGTVDSRGIAYHDGCAGLRELGIRAQPRALLRDLCGIAPAELEQRDVCCGFGGTFCAKMPAISAKMADDKLDDALAQDANTLLAGDLGCLLHLAGRARRRGLDLELRHVAEVLAGATDTAAIGRGQ